MLIDSNSFRKADKLNPNSLSPTSIDPGSLDSVSGMASSLIDPILLTSRVRSSLLETEPQSKLIPSKLAELPALLANSSLETASFNTITNHTIASQSQFLKPKAFHQAAEISKALEYYYSTSHSSENQILPGVELSTTASVDVHAEIAARLRGEVSGQIAPDNIAVHLEGEAFVGGAVSVDAAYQSALTLAAIDTSIGTTGEGNADAMAGAGASGQADIGLSSDDPHLELQGEAFAGSRASADASAGLTVNGETIAEVNGSVESQAGVGASGKLDVGYENGELQFEMGVGLALGIGAKVEIGGSIDVPDVVGIPLATTVGVVSESIETAVEVVSEVGSTAKEITTEIASGVADIGSELASGDIIGAISEVGSTTVDVITDVASGAVDVVSNVASGIVDIVSDVGSGIKKATKKVGKFFRSLF